MPVTTSTTQIHALCVPLGPSLSYKMSTYIRFCPPDCVCGMAVAHWWFRVHGVSLYLIVTCAYSKLVLSWSVPVSSHVRGSVGDYCIIVVYLVLCVCV